MTVTLVLLALAFTSTLACLGAVGGAVAMFLKVVRDHPVYQETVPAAVSDPEVQALLGIPVEPGFIPQASLDRRQMQLNLNLKGPLDEGQLRVQALHDGNEWMYDQVVVMVPSRGLEIDLRAQVDPAGAAVERAGDAYSLLDAAGILLEAGDKQAALNQVQQAVALNPGNADAWYMQGVLLAELGELDEAVRSLEMAGDVERDRVDVPIALAGIAVQQERWILCQEQWTRVLKVDAEHMEAWYGRARCYESQGMKRHALAGAQKSCDLGWPEACDMARRLGEPRRRGRR